MKWLWLALCPTVAVLSLSASAESFEISQSGRQFHPDSITIKAGDTLLIHNDDEFLHHIYVKSPDFNYDSSEQVPGKTLAVTFPRPGDYSVRCEIHPKMLLRVHAN
jgi:plastocyanin